MSFLEHLSQFHERRPFRPFVIRTDDGRGFVIGDPQSLMINDRTQRFAVFTPEGSFAVMEAGHVVGVEEPAPAAR